MISTSELQFIKSAIAQKRAGFLKSKSGVVVPGQPGSLILLAHEKYCCPSQIFDEQQQQIIRSVCPVDN
jgi:hypothetical protein